MANGRRARTGTILHRLAERTEHLSRLDAVADRLAASADAAVRRAGAKELLSGSWFGHPLHPLATDAVIGAWAMALVLDLGGEREFRRAADRLVGLGFVAAAPTAAAGASDWVDMTDSRARRMGLVHATSNVTAVALNGASFVARKLGRRQLGRRLTMSSAAALALGGYLGAHLAYVRGVGVSHAAFDEDLSDWTPLAHAADVGSRLIEGRAGDLRLFVVRAADGVPQQAAGGRCTHCGASLDPTDEGGALRCPGDGTAFRVADGAVLRGPGTTPIPVFETRREGDRLEIRARR